MEAKLTGILGKFYVQHGIHGERVVTRAQQLTGNCTSDREIDTNIQLLKDDLDACAREIKRRRDIDGRGALFEGWLPAKDDSVMA